jgi:hypothetical protein
MRLVLPFGVLQLRALRVGSFQDEEVEIGLFSGEEKLGKPSLLRQPHFLYQFSKPWIGTYGIE